MALETSYLSSYRPNPLNYLITLIDTFSFNFGMAFLSLTTIVPLFLHQLHSSNSLIGVLPALVSLGYSLPGLFVAKRVARLRVAKWWLFWFAVGERIPLLGIALLIPRIGLSNPSLTLLLFILAFAIHSVMLGLNQPAYWSFIGKTVPANIRGRVYGWAGAVGGVLGLSVEPITRHFLTPASIANLSGFGACFTLGIIILLVGILPFAAIDEPVVDAAAKRDSHEGHFVQDAIKAWQAEPGFRSIVISQFVASAVLLAQPFYVLRYAHSYNLTGAVVAQFTAITVIASALSSLVWGYIADHFGNKIVLVIGAVLGLLAPAIIVLNPPAALYNCVFLLLALSISAFTLAGFNIVVEYPGDSSAVPFYVTIFNTVLTPVRVLGPILGGIIADSIGYEAVFGAAAVAGLLSVAAMVQVKDPRREANGAVS